MTVVSIGADILPWFIGIMIFLLVILIILIVMWVAIPPKRDSSYGENEFDEEVSNIRHQVEHEAGDEAEEELMPYKPPRLDKPDRKRI